jgi:uncharacterized protein
MSRSIRAAGFVLLLAGMFAQSSVDSVRASSAGVVISQVYGGGGNAGAPLRNDYVELFNAGTTAVDITGWSLQYSTAVGSGWNTGKTILTGTIPAGHYFLVQGGGGTNGADLPTADVVGTANMAAGNGKVALVSDSTTLTGTCPSGGSLVDFVGWGYASPAPTGSCFETTTAPAISNTTAVFRNGSGCTDTDNNGADFAAASPAPRNSATAAISCAAGGGDDTTPPVITVPADLTAQTTSTSAVVTFVATAVDNLDGAIVPSCAPASGSAFPIGTTLVTCTAADVHGNNASASFHVTVALQDANIIFAQDWSNHDLITTNNVWSGVPGVVGYNGAGLISSSATGVDPQTVLADVAAGSPTSVLANQSNPNITNGGIAEFDGLSNSTVAFQGSGAAPAPFLLITFSTMGKNLIHVGYNLRDIDASSDNAAQPVALQYRIGTTGDFTNVPDAFVADASDGPSLASKVTAVSAILPDEVNNQPVVQIRILTTNAAGSDEWIGVDDIVIDTITTPTNPTMTVSAVPNAPWPGDPVVLTATVHNGRNPTSTGMAVTADLSAIGGPASQQLVDDGTHGDVTAGDNIFSFQMPVAAATPIGPKMLPVNLVDAQSRSASASIALTVTQPTTLTAIHDIQGPASTSPLVGQSVTTTGIVTAVKSNGMFLQAPDDQVDADPLTSEGIFVFGSISAGQVSVGQLVRVAAEVSEFIPSSDLGSLPTTELQLPTVVVLANSQPLPAPRLLTIADINASSGSEPLERYEGMRVLIDSLVVVGPTSGNVDEAHATSTSDGSFYAVMPGVARPFREPGIQAGDPAPPEAVSPGTIPRFDLNPERIRVETVTLKGAATPVDATAGATVTNVVGVVDFRFRTYTILTEPASPPSVTGNISAVPVRDAGADEFTVAAFNMERFFDTTDDPELDVALTPAAFANRLNKASLAIRNVLKSPDIIGVEEMEHQSTLQMVADKVNSDAIAAGQPNVNYQAFLVEGNDVGGIDSGFLVNQSRVEVLDVTQLEKDTTYIDPTTNQPALLNDRPPLVLRARIIAPPHDVYPVTVIVNHLRSLSGIDDPVDGLRIRTKKRAQAEDLANLIQARQAADSSEHIISLGDYNSFGVNDGYVDVVATVKGSPTPPALVAQASPDLVEPNLIDLVGTVPASQRYSYVFDGNAQELDHVLVTGNVRARLQYARNDADFPETYRNDANRPERISDHDPLVAFVAMPAPDVTGPDIAVPAPITVEATGPLTTVSYTVTANDNVDGPVPASCSPPSGSGFAVGTTTVMCRAVDAHANSSIAFFDITVRDTIAPAIASVQVTPDVLWPPNKHMEPVTVSVSAADLVSTATCRLTGITANDSATSADWLITGPLAASLRADRTGGGKGRTYLLAVECADAAGNTARATGVVNVPHSR